MGAVGKMDQLSLLLFTIAAAAVPLYGMRFYISKVIIALEGRQGGEAEGLFFALEEGYAMAIYTYKIL